MSGLPIAIGAGLFVYMMNREQVVNAQEENKDNIRRKADAEKTVRQRNRQVKKTKEQQDDPDEELHRKPRDRAGNNDMSGQEDTYDSMPNEQTEPLPPRVIDDEGYAEVNEQQQMTAKPQSEFENQTIKDNGKIMDKSGTGGSIN